MQSATPSASSSSSSPTAPASYASAASRSAASRSRVRSSMRATLAAPLLVLSFATSGCYLGHVAAGQMRLLAARRPLDVVLADPATPEPVRERLALAPQARELA